MRERLTKAFEEASKLPVEIQDEVADRLLEDLIAERQWDKTLERTQAQLGRMADKALADFKAGRTEEMGFDEL